MVNLLIKKTMFAFLESVIVQIKLLVSYLHCLPPPLLYFQSGHTKINLHEIQECLTLLTSQVNLCSLDHWSYSLMVRLCAHIICAPKGYYIWWLFELKAAWDKFLREYLLMIMQNGLQTIMEKAGKAGQVRVSMQRYIAFYRMVACDLPYPAHNTWMLFLPGEGITFWFLLSGVFVSSKNFESRNPISHIFLGFIL